MRRIAEVGIIPYEPDTHLGPGCYAEINTETSINMYGGDGHEGCKFILVSIDGHKAMLTDGWDTPESYFLRIKDLRFLDEDEELKIRAIVALHGGDWAVLDI